LDQPSSRLCKSGQIPSPTIFAGTIRSRIRASADECHTGCAQPVCETACIAAAESNFAARARLGQAAVALMIATAMQALDATIANVALPQLQESLGGGIELGSWVMTSYLCASAVMAVLTGWLRRRYGPRRLFVGSVGLFAVASVLCSLAPTMLSLIEFRLVQGAAGGIIQPLAQAILLDIYPKQKHGRMLAVWGATIMAGPILGPLLGGIITDFASWRWIFALNVPLGLISILGLWRVPIPVAGAERLRIDGIGIALLVLGVGSLQLALQRSIGHAWPLSSEIIAEAAIALLALAAIAMRSFRSQFTLFDLRVFANRNFATSAFFNYVVGAILFTSIVFLPALSEGPLGYNATQAGLALSPRGIGTMATMLLMSWLIDRVDSRAMLAAGFLITAGALAMVSRPPVEGSEIWLAAANAIQGIGVGLLFTPLSTLAFSGLAAELRTDAAGIYNLLRQLGCATGVAMMTAVLQAGIQANLVAFADRGEGSSSPDQIADMAVFSAYSACFGIMAVVIVMILPGVLLYRVLRPGEDDVLPRAA
jgi:MFS transporter, DHA2 family, multidrug resistance protein